MDGNFEFNGLKSGFIKLQLSSVGYKGIITTEFNITQVRPNYVEIKLEATTEQLDEVKVSASPYANRAEARITSYNVCYTKLLRILVSPLGVV